MLPTGRHDDWIFPLSLISRSATSFEAPPPKKWFGNAALKQITWEGKVYSYPPPIPDQGQWWFGSRFAFAWRGKGRWYVRVMLFGRFDDLALYFSWPSFTVKRY